MEKSHLLGEFLVKNKVITADHLLIAIEDQRSQARELGLMEHMKDYLSEEEVQKVVMRQFEKNETFEEAILDMGYLTQEKLAQLPINEKAYRTPLGQVLLKFQYITEGELNIWLAKFESQTFDDDYEQVKLLKNVPVFANLDDHILKGVVPMLKYRYHAAGEMIFKEGFDSDNLYMIESGLVRLSVKTGSDEMELDSMGSGYSFGLPGVLSNRPRMERAVAIMNSRIWRMSREDVHHVLTDNPESALIAARLVSEKVQDMLGTVKSRKPRVHSGNIHVVIFDEKAYDEGIVGALVRRLNEEATGETLLVHSMKHPEWIAATTNNPKHLDRAERRLLFPETDGDKFWGVYLPGVEELYNEGEEIQDLENLSYWINKEAKNYRSVIFLTDPGHIQFRSMMMGVARRSAIFIGKRVPDFVQYCKTSRDRVYLMDNLSATEISSNFNQLKKICSDTLAPNLFRTKGEDLDRSCGQIARYLVGKTIGLALGGGGARGMAHVGVIQVLAEQGIEFDAVSGASAGSIFGAALAYGYNSEEIYDITTDLMTRKPFSDWRLIPLKSFSKGRRAKRLLKKVFDNTLTYETKIPFFPVACDMHTGAAINVKGVPIWKACKASGAAPGLMVPETYGDMILQDGGIVDNVPAAALHNFGIDFIIAVNISVTLEESPYNPDAAFSSIMRSIDIMGYHTVTRHKDFTDIDIEPEISEFSVMDWEKGHTILERGREAMEKKVPELRYLLKKLMTT